MLAGPPLFHPRGMGPRGMRPNMRTPFGPGGSNGGPRGGPPFDRDGPDMPFFRPDIFDEGRGPIGPPPIGGGRPGLFGLPPPEGRLGGPPGGSLLGNAPGDGPWRNDGGPPMPMPPSREGPHGPEEDLHSAKEKHSRGTSADREKRRENRKSR